MRRKPLALVLVGLMILSAFLGGCRRNSAAPPLEDLTAEEEAQAAIEEAQANTDELQEEPPVVTEEPVAEPEVTEAEPEPELIEETAEPTPVTEETTAPVEQATEEPVVEPTTEPTTAVTTDGTTHVVQPGENMFRIALQYGTTVQAISQANNITNPAMIYVGQSLQIPPGTVTTPPSTNPGQACATVYVVRPGDNLFRIALRYNYSQFYLAQHNGISNPSMVYVGQQICIP